MSPSWPEMIKLYSLEEKAKKYIIYVGKISSMTVCVTVVVSAILLLLQYFFVYSCFHLTNYWLSTMERPLWEARFLFSWSSQSSLYLRCPHFYQESLHKCLDFRSQCYVLSLQEVLTYFWIWATKIGRSDRNRRAVNTWRTSTHDDQGMQLCLHKNLTIQKANITTIPEFVSSFSLLRKFIRTHTHSYI